MLEYQLICIVNNDSWLHCVALLWFCVLFVSMLCVFLSLAEQTDLMPEIDLEMTGSAIAAE